MASLLSGVSVGGEGSGLGSTTVYFTVVSFFICLVSPWYL